MSYNHDRAYYRIQYPVFERPRLLIDGEPHPVVDCSENGLRYLPVGGKLPRIGVEIRGVLCFRRGAKVEVEGVVVRVQEGEVAVHLPSAGIPLAIIFNEQIYLRRHYPMRDG